MYRGLNVAVVIPCYNEEKLIKKTVTTLPSFIETIVIIDDGSTDNTIDVVKKLKKTDNRVHLLENGENQGLGYSLKNGFRYTLNSSKADIIGVAAGDAQCDPNYIQSMLDALLDNKLDYVKANRFYHHDALKAMPIYRKVGNIFISLLTKFSTGYYSISDTQNGYGFFTKNIMQRMNLDFIGNRYDYENSVLIALSIAGARIKDHPVPAVYGEETSTIKFLPTAIRALKAIWIGFWRRIYYKYILYSFHPISLFLLCGFILLGGGIIAGLILVYVRIFSNAQPSTGTVMAVAMPIILGIQLLLSALTMDMYSENRD